MRTSRNGGFALVSVAILTAITLTFGLILIDSAFSSRRAGRFVRETFSALQIAEAGVEKAVYCLNQSSTANCGGTAGTLYSGETNVAFGGGSFTTTLAGSGSSRTITSTGTSPTARQATIIVTATSVPRTDDPAFSYALQAGDGGAHLENNAEITGTIYSDGDVDCQSTQAGVTGDAYVSKVGGAIEQCDIGFHAHADKILDSEVGGDAYYQNDPADIEDTDVEGNKYSGSTTPAMAPLPALDLEFWRESAENGGLILGDYAPADNSSLGPVKIAGNLIMNNNVDLTVNGPIWVVGDITTGNGNSFSLSPNFGPYSTVILADDPNDNAGKGRVTISNGTSVSGSGSPTSHILFASTNSSMNDAVPAISVANTAGGAVFLALSGVLRLENNAGAKSLAGRRLFIDQRGIITYVESDFSGLFSNSPSTSWRLLEETWREQK